MDVDERRYLVGRGVVTEIQCNMGEHNHKNSYMYGVVNKLMCMCLHLFNRITARSLASQTFVFNDGCQTRRWGGGEGGVAREGRPILSDHAESVAVSCLSYTGYAQKMYLTFFSELGCRYRYSIKLVYSG